MHTKNECVSRRLQAEYILDIANVTDEDVGEYFCQMYCADFEELEKDAIELVTILQPGTLVQKYCFNLLIHVHLAA